MTAAPPIVASFEKKTPSRAIARASWIAPLIGLGANFLLVASGAQTRLASVFISVIFLGGGLLLGVVALCGMIKHGRKGILWPALIGICIPVALCVLALPSLSYARRHAFLNGPPVAVVHSASARLLKDEKIRFSMDIPDGFAEWPEGMTGPKMAYCFARSLSGSQGGRLVLNIQQLNGVIPPDAPLSRAEVVSHAPAGVELDLIQKDWRGLKVDTFVTKLTQNGVQMIAFGIQIPLSPRAIQVNIGGPMSEQPQVERLANEILNSLDGNSNWRIPKQ